MMQLFTFPGFKTVAFSGCKETAKPVVRSRFIDGLLLVLYLSFLITHSSTSIAGGPTAPGKDLLPKATFSNSTATVNTFACPTLAFTVPSAAAVTQCANTTLNLSVSTTAKGPDAIQFVYFTSPLTTPTNAYTATGGTVLGTVVSGTATTNTVSLTNVQLPDNVGSTAKTIYIYALLQAADGLCQVAAQRTVILNPRPAVVIGGDAIFCQGTATQLTALGVSGGTYQWYFNGGTAPISTANPYNTTAINTTTTYQVRATLAGCVSDLVSYTLTPVVCTSCAGGPTTIGGQVYQDFKSEGARQTNDLGVGGVTVTIFQCDATGQSTQVAQMPTDINGAYSFTGLTAGADYRVEFSNLPVGTEPTFRGSQNGTTVQFTKPGSCSISLGVNYPADFCQATPKVVVPCYENGTGTGSTAAGFVSFDYSSTTKRVDGTIGEIGSVWGVAYQRSSRKAFTTAFLKRHVGFAAQGPGGVYVYDYNNPAVDPPLVASFSLQNVVAANGGPAIDLGTVTRVTSPATDPNYISTDKNALNYDIDAFAKVGKMSFGDADMDETNSRLWLVNLYQRAIISVNISGTATALNGASTATLSPLTHQYLLDNLPGVPACGTDGVFRPWALAFHRGKGYLGGVCTSETSQDKSKLQAYVLEFDPNNVEAGFTTVMTVPMNYPREQVENKSITSFFEYRVGGTWKAWINTYADIVGAPAAQGRIAWPQPILSDIAFADNGDMVMGFTDRLTHQWGKDNRPPIAGSTAQSDANGGGDILHACFVNGKWVLEGTAGSCKTNDILTNSGFVLANDGPSKTGEFYPNDQYFDGTNGHYETSNGALVIQPGQNEVITTAYDITGLFQQGVKYFSTTTGANKPGSFAVIPNGNTISAFGKGNGLGDLEILCDLAPIQIGNRVWRDDNQNGIQDPCEPAIPGAVVKLYDAAKTTVIASATTNAAGEYYFSSATVVAGTSTSSVSTSLLTYNTTYALVITSLGTSSVVTGLSITNISPVTPGESGTTNTGTTLANNDAKLDMVGGINSPTILLTTGDVGENNHTYDFGITVPPCVKPTLATIASQSICQGSGAFSFPLVSSIVSNTVTSLQWYTTNAAGTSFTAISGATSLSLSAAQAVAPTAGQIKYYALIGQNGLSALCSDTVFVNLYQKATQTISFVNGNITQCANTTMNLSVSTNAKAPDAIKFVYFTSPLSSATDAYTATGGTVLGTVTSGTLATNTVTLTNAQLPDLVGSTTKTLYVYALLQSPDGLCLPAAQLALTLNPRPSVAVGGNPVFCQGKTTVLTASGPAGSTFQWYLNAGTSVVSTANPYTTPAISTTTTYRVRGTLAGCVSDDASIVLTPVVCTSCAATPTSLGGVAYRDFNSDGTKGTDDADLSNVTVTIFTCDANGASTQVATMQTDINGAYSFTGLTAGTTYRVEFSNLPAGYDPTFRGTQNGTTVQFTQPGSCSTSLGLNVPVEYCQTNPKLVTPCYLDGAVTPNTTALTDVLVSLNYDLTGKTVEATRTEIGSTWGVAYARSTKQLYTGAFLKRHVGLKDGKLGQIYVSDFTTPGTPTTPWLDVSTLPGIAGNWTYLTDAQRGLTNAGTASRDSLAFSKVATVGLGDVDISDDDKTLYVMDLTNRQLLAIDIATKTLIGKYPVPSVCTTTPTTSYFSAGAGNTLFTSTDGKLWKKGYAFDLAGTSLNYSQPITNPNSVTAGTNNAALYANSAYTPTTMRYSFPVGNGTFGVKLHMATNLAGNGRNTTVSAEGVAVPSLTNFDTYAQAGNQVNVGITRSFTTTVTDGVLTLDFRANPGGGAALVSGFELTPLNSTSAGETRPFGLAVRHGKVYVGTVCDASYSQSRNDMQASVLEFNPATGTYAATPALTFALNYKKGANAGGCNNSWEPWTSVYPNNTANGIGCTPFEFYAQPVLSDIEFDLDGSMILGFFDRMGHQMGAVSNFTPDGRVSNNGAVGGDILRAYFNGTSYEPESNGREGVSSTKPVTTGQNNNEGPGGGEFYYGDNTSTGPSIGHFEISMGGLAYKPGAGDIRLTAGDPLVYNTGGILSLDNTTGAKITANSIALYTGGVGGVQYKSNGLGDLEILCDLAPIQIGNRVWRDDNQNGIQDPCEPAIPGAVVKLYDAAKTTVIASATTNAAGEYYFSSATVVAGTSTSSVSTSLLTYNTNYALVITSLGTSTVVTAQGLSLTDVSPLTPGESGSVNSGTSPINNDAKVDVVGGLSLPCIKLTTGGPGENNHTYDFGIAKFVCSLSVTAAPSSTLICATSSATLTVGCQTGTPLWSTGETIPSIIVTPPNTTTYSVVCQSGSCVSPPAVAIVTVAPQPSVGPDQTLTCSNGVVPSSATLTAQTNSSVLTGQWYAQPGNPSATTFANATSLTTTVSGLLPGQTYRFVWANTTTGCANGVVINVGTCGPLPATYRLAKSVDLNRTVKGGIVTYTISLTNTGGTTGTNVVVTDQFSTTAVTFIGSATASSGTFTPAGNSGSWSIASLAPGQVATLALRVQLDAEGITYNTATAPNGQTATVCTSVPFKVCANASFQFILTATTGQASYQWSRNGQPITGATSNTLSATEVGEYTISGGCPNGTCCPFIIEATLLPSLTALATAATCTGATPLSNAKISLVGSSTNAISYNISLGNSFTASAPLFATNQSLALVVGSVLASGLPNPALAPGQVYTIRVYSADGCYSDTLVTIPPAQCNCTPVCVPVKVRRTR
ncbi:SdrD B-like domain-containing protein [Fibrella aquatica]|uniref:SdrD B-like domain-containing protein n=1 Tax=Fibrella aquatica TaxID=3242487 RepID=UPI003520DA4F